MHSSKFSALNDFDLRSRYESAKNDLSEIKKVMQSRGLLAKKESNHSPGVVTTINREAHKIIAQAKSLGFEVTTQQAIEKACTKQGIEFHQYLKKLVERMSIILTNVRVIEETVLMEKVTREKINLINVALYQSFQLKTKKVGGQVLDPVQDIIDHGLQGNDFSNWSEPIIDHNLIVDYLRSSSKMNNCIDHIKPFIDMYNEQNARDEQI